MSFTAALLDPAWRWHKSEAYADSKISTPRSEDSLVRRTSRYLSRLNKDDSVISQSYLEKDYPDIHWAYKIWAASSGPKWYIEALITCGESNESIAEYLGQSKSILDTYEKLFFDVRARLSHKGYIISQILAHAVERGMYDREYDFFWKLLALIIGADGLKNFWDSGRLNEVVITELHGMLRAKILKDAVAAAHVRKITQYNANEIIAQCLEMTAAESETSVEKQHSAVVDGLKTLLSSMKFNVSPVNAESDGPIEPRIDHLLETIGENKDGTVYG